MAKYIKEKLYTLSKKHLLFSFFKKLPIWLIVLMEYVVFVGLIVYIFSSIIPSVKAEINSITNEFLVINTVDEDNKNFEFIDSEKSGSIKIINAINDFKESLLQKIILIDPEDNLKIIDYIENFGKDFDFKSFKNNSIYILSVLGNSIFKIILALILSFVFILDRKELNIYLLKIKKSNFSFLYDEYQILFEKVIKSLGLILKAQGVIAFVNSILTVIGLIIIGFVFSTPEIQSFPYFPYILTLGIVVFVMGFIPVVGVFLSSIPIILIGYITYGQILIIPAIILLILIIHMIEAYYLNPKVFSSYLKLPMSLTFIILLTSEHFFGLAGLLIGMSFFYFFLGLIEDFNEMIGKNKKKLKLKNEKKKKKTLQKNKSI